jgi:hypothetical protein
MSLGSSIAEAILPPRSCRMDTGNARLSGFTCDVRLWF